MDSGFAHDNPKVLLDPLGDGDEACDARPHLPLDIGDPDLQLLAVEGIAGQRLGVRDELPSP
jgi:hypothetical protein